MISFDIYGSSTCSLAPFANHLFHFSIFFYRLHRAIHECSYSGMKINMTQHYTLRTGNEIIEITKPY